MKKERLKTEKVDEEIMKDMKLRRNKKKKTEGREMRKERTRYEKRG